MINKRSTTALASLVELLDILDQLETLRAKRSHLKKETQIRINIIRNRYALITGVIVGLLVVFLLFLAEGAHVRSFFVFENFIRFGVIAFIIAAIVSCVLFLILWENGRLKYFSERTHHQIMDEIQSERMQLLKQTTALLSLPVIQESEVPMEYLTPKSIEILQRYIQTSQSDTIHEAVQLFEMDLETKNVRYSKLFKGHDSLVSKEREYVEHWSERE